MWANDSSILLLAFDNLRNPRAKPFFLSWKYQGNVSFRQQEVRPTHSWNVASVETRLRELGDLLKTPS
ncbi:hypothetical protein HZH66_010533 [Vespula vulgaris]|uniref:Uncharacterized protein n=1 Tax=Vespula vulgaris TaxID=7454 RepID=A0A834JLW7_VESVU|nr:hypothetical protein HZH66_010533 [Vespula vulgaris]